MIISFFNKKKINRVPEIIGTIWEDLFGRTILGSNYLQAGTGTYSIDLSSGKLVMSRTYDNNFFSTYIERQDYLSLDYFDIEAIVKVNSKSATTYGLGFSLIGQGERAQYNFSVQFRLNDSIGIFQYVNPSTPIVNQNTGSTTFSVGDTLKLKLSRNRYTYTATIDNVTSPNATTTLNITNYTPNQLTRLLNNECKIRLNIFSGDYDIQSFKVSSQAYKNVNTLWIGDSISVAYLTDNVSQRTVNQLWALDSNRYCTLAGSGETSGDLHKKQTLISLINPKYCVIDIGMNDCTSNFNSTATYLANLQNFVTFLRSRNITPIFCTITPANIADVTSYNAVIQNNFSQYKIIDNYTVLKGSGTNINALYYGDGVHPNILGNSVRASNVLSVAPEII